MTNSDGTATIGGLDRRADTDLTIAMVIPFALILTTVLLCVYMVGKAHMWQSEDNFEDPVPSFTFMGFQGLNSGDQSCVASPSAH